MNKVIISIIVVIIVFVGGYFLFSDTTTTTTTTELPAENTRPETVITYTNEGFTPKEITIKNGTTVAFKNKTSGSMWVASGPHPTHENYPEFDAKRTYNPGENYVFTFTKIGTWGYHNHVGEQHFGKVIVE